MRILVYSGDTDAVFTAGGTRTWVETLGLAPDAPWRAWMDAMAWSEVGLRLRWARLLSCPCAALHHSLQPPPLRRGAASASRAGRRRSPCLPLSPRSPAALQPGGFMQVYAGPTNGTGGLTFATILEAGQNAAYFKPIKTLQLVRAFTNNVLKLRPPPPA